VRCRNKTHLAGAGLGKLRVQLTKSSVQMRLTTVQPKGGGNRGEHSSVRANDSKRVGGSSRTQNLFSHLRLVSDPIWISHHGFRHLRYLRPKYEQHLWRH
jgi:hypothetical protein